MWVLRFIDLAIVSLSFIITQVILNDGHAPAAESVLISFAALLPAYGVALAIIGVYKVIWRYADIYGYIRLITASFVGCVIYASEEYFRIGLDDIRVVLFTASIATLLLVLSRMSRSLILQGSTGTKRSGKRTMIVGAGYSASFLINECGRESGAFLPVCMVDDDASKVGRVINNVRVMGTTSQIPQICSELNIASIIFAIPSCNEKNRRRILSLCTEAKCELKIMPELSQVVQDIDLVKKLRDVKIEDLLYRKPVTFCNDQIKEYLEGKCCFVTGGGGSIGSELCRQISRYDLDTIVIVDNYENNAYEIQQELLRKYNDKIDLRVEIASVADYNKMEHLFSYYHPNVVFHAAAHKHVPLMETNPEEAVKNNIFGTYYTAMLAGMYGVSKFVLISTDKAVNPTNVMGATKHCCEKVIQCIGKQYPATEYAAVRFGNVLGSNGSAIPLFMKQIKEGGPVTVTDPAVERYFMTIPEAVSLVLQAGAFAEGGEIFILDMGDPVKIITLAEQLISLSGFKPYEDIDVRFTGLRPGEKLIEELILNKEAMTSTQNDKIFVDRQMPFDYQEFYDLLKQLKEAAYTNRKNDIIRILKQMTPSFAHQEKDYETELRQLIKIS